MEVNVFFPRPVLKNTDKEHLERVVSETEIKSAIKVLTAGKAAGEFLLNFINFFNTHYILSLNV